MPSNSTFADSNAMDEPGGSTELGLFQSGSLASYRAAYDPLNPPRLLNFDGVPSFNDDVVLSPSAHRDPVKRSNVAPATPTPVIAASLKHALDLVTAPPRSQKRYRWETVYAKGYGPQTSPLKLPRMHVDRLRLNGEEPLWMVDAVKYLDVPYFGSEWTRLVDTWFMRECSTDWRDCARRVGMKNAPSYAIEFVQDIRTSSQKIHPLLDISISDLLDQYSVWYTTVRESRNNLTTITSMHGAYCFLGVLFYAGSHIYKEVDGEAKRKWLENVETITDDLIAIIRKDDAANVVK